MKRLHFLTMLLASSAHAHHGQDFFVTLDTRVPEFASGSVFMASSWAKTSGADETEVDAGFLGGLGGGFAVGATFQASNESPGDFGYAGFTPLLQWSAAVPVSGLRIGAAAAYHFADSSHAVSHFSVHRHTTAASTGPGPGWNPDAPPDGGSHSHSHSHHHAHDHGGIHRHGEDHFQLRVIAEWQATERTRIVANMLAVGASSDDVALGYAIGIRRELTARLAVGMEMTGDLDSHGAHDVIAGAYFSPLHEVTLRFGVGTGFGPGATDLSVQGGVTWRF